MDASRIKWLVMDIDGTLTDGKIYMGPSGEAMKAFDVKDGYAISNILPELNIKPVVITGRDSEIVAYRCAELGVEHIFQGVKNKVSILDALLTDSNSQYCEVAYIGDDLNDLECMKRVQEFGGILACPADAVNAITTVCDFVMGSRGGFGAVREFIEIISTHKMQGVLCE